MEDNNTKTIENFIHKHFSLKSSSNFRFSEALYNRFIDPLYKPYIDENYRIMVELPDEHYESFDKGWSYFLHCLPQFIEKYNIEYKDFRRNKVVHNKNTLRIFKILKSYFLGNDGIKVDPEKEEEYKEFLSSSIGLFIEIYSLVSEHKPNVFNREFVEAVMKIFLDKINEVRFSVDKNMYAVLTLNFRDMFLSSTSEDWSSCLNLESRSYAAYWSSLPGIVVDKNLAMLYITNGSEKYYEGVVAPKVLARSFVLLDKEGIPNIVKFYPNEVIPLDAINEFFPFKFKRIDENFESKYSIYPLYYKNEFSCYVYQDKTYPIHNNDGSFYLKYGGKGLYTFIDNKYFEGPIFNWTGGFSNLMARGQELNGKYVQPVNCDKCNKLISGARVHKLEDELLCKDCHSKAMEEMRERDNVQACVNCGIILDPADVFYNDFDEPYCEDCY